MIIIRTVAEARAVAAWLRRKKVDGPGLRPAPNQFAVMLLQGADRPQPPNADKSRASETTGQSFASPRTASAPHGYLLDQGSCSNNVSHERHASPACQGVSFNAAVDLFRAKRDEK